ncbi:MAG: DUF2066 domain-containing protein [Gammaproteobacteria bacterium]|nr:DUF2066 domain-containing protein [Gammaproteobacteria bacterium]MBU1653405.1 DUF2066 domain-containing protein [Gammaproteobacteria bacterium]MBU1962351.1 DUF2066 domain-containing protein [Gammaproteobacteria bacterium]
MISGPFRAFLTLLLLWSASAFLLAAPVADLYEGEAAVPDESPQQRDKAMAEAFLQVVVKMGGDRKLAERADVRQAAATAGQYVRQFRYFSAGSGASAQRRIRVSFDGIGLSAWMRKTGLPEWERDRPSPLVWLVQEEAGQRWIIAPEDPNSPYTALKEAAGVRGLPLLTPLMDLQERSNGLADKLWSGSGPEILALSKRYQPDAVLVGRIAFLAEDRWESRWTLYRGGQGEDWTDYAPTPAEAAGMGADRAADSLASGQAKVAQQAPEPLVIRIAGAGGTDDRDRLAEHLRQLPPVVRSKVMESGPGFLTFQLSVRGGKSALEQAIASGGLLRPDQPPPPQPSGKPNPQPVEPPAQPASRGAPNPLDLFDLPQGARPSPRKPPEPVARITPLAAEPPPPADLFYAVIRAR